MRLMLAVLGTALIGANAHARPVSWPGGLTWMQELDPGTGSVLVHYTPNRHYSIGGRYLRMRDEGTNLSGIQAIWLVNRWNMAGAQANLYLSGLAGGAWRAGEAVRPAGFVDVQADWENRRVMVMGMARLTSAEGMGSSDMQLARFGWAPYAGAYGDAHLWLFAQVKRDAGADDAIQPALVARIFYRTLLVEAGVTDRGGLILNSQIRF